MEDLSAMELAQKLGIEVVGNRLRAVAIKELLVEKGLITEVEYRLKFQTLLDDKSESYIKELLER